jgi:hypothetical protein
MDLLILTLYLQSDIKIDNLQTKCAIDEKIVGLDIPMGDTKPMKMPEAFDEALTELIDLARELHRSDPEIIRDGVHFGNNDPQPRLRVERVEQWDDVSCLGDVKKFEDHKFI